MIINILDINNNVLAMIPVNEDDKECILHNSVNLIEFENGIDVVINTITDSHISRDGITNDNK